MRVTGEHDRRVGLLADAVVIEIDRRDRSIERSSKVGNQGRSTRFCLDEPLLQDELCQQSSICRRVKGDF